MLAIKLLHINAKTSENSLTPYPKINESYIPVLHDRENERVGKHLGFSDGSALFFCHNPGEDATQSLRCNWIFPKFLCMQFLVTQF